MRPGGWARSAAYCCFAYITLVGVVAGVIAALPLSFEAQQVIGMVVGIPVVMLGFAAAVCGVALTVFVHREWPLVAMSAALITAVTIGVYSDGLPTERYRVLEPVFGGAIGLSVLVIVVLSGRWMVTVVRPLVRRDHEEQ